MAATGGALLQRVRRLLGAPSSHTGRGPAWLAGSVALLLIGGIAIGADGRAPEQRARGAPPFRPRRSSPRAQALRIAWRSPERLERSRSRLERMPDRLHASGRAPEAPVAAGTAGPCRAPPAPEAPPSAAAGCRKRRPRRLRLLRRRSALRRAPPAPAAPRRRRRTSASATTSTTRTATGAGRSNGEKLQVSYRGAFEFTDDDTDVRQVSAGGYLKISDGAWFGRHSVEIRERGGQLDRRYYVNGSERPYEPDGRVWLRDNLPKFVRNTGIGAPARVARFLKSGGVTAVMGEIGRIDSTYVKGIYFKELFKQATLTPEQYRQAMAQASREMKSDYELAQLLIAVADRLPGRRRLARRVLHGRVQHLVGLRAAPRLFDDAEARTGERRRRSRAS